MRVKRGPDFLCALATTDDDKYKEAVRATSQRQRKEPMVTVCWVEADWGENDVEVSKTIVWNGGREPPGTRSCSGETMGWYVVSPGPDRDSVESLFSPTALAPRRALKASASQSSCASCASRCPSFPSPHHDSL